LCVLVPLYAGERSFQKDKKEEEEEEEEEER